MDELKVGDRVVIGVTKSPVGTVIKADKGDPLVRVRFRDNAAPGWWKRTSLKRVDVHDGRGRPGGGDDGHSDPCRLHVKSKRRKDHD